MATAEFARQDEMLRPTTVQLAKDNPIEEEQKVRLIAAPQHCHLFDRAGRALPSNSPGSLVALVTVRRDLMEPA